MKQYVYNLIPRLKQYSESLDKKELFVGLPWVYIDEHDNKQKYIFQRNGDLIMSLNGQVTMGKWEYLASAKSLLIDRVIDKILLNQAFIDPALMILKKDGFQNEFFFLANEILIPDLNISDYIQKFYHRAKNIRSLKLKDGQILEIHDYDYDSSLFGKEVTIEASPVTDGVYEEAASNRKVAVKNGKIHNVYVLQVYETNHGPITIEKSLTQGEDIKKGYPVFQDGQPAPDGKYRLDFLYSINVKDGKIAKA